MTMKEMRYEMEEAVMVVVCTLVALSLFVLSRGDAEYPSSGRSVGQAWQAQT